jgi:ribosomal protein S12 methylthiotransferase
MKKIMFVSLGCDKNLVDTEHMLGALPGTEFVVTDTEDEADAIVINTCCFIEEAKEESIQTILDLAKCKMEGVCKALIVSGCMAQRYREEILSEIPEVDGIVGTGSFEQIEDAIRGAFEGKRTVLMSDPSKAAAKKEDKPRKKKRVITTGGHYEYLKIAEGCDKHCTYCVIPSLRGKYRSVPMEELVEEAEGLVEEGVKELILIAEETTLYGVDLYGKKSLHLLLKKLCAIDELKWIRVLYCYPEEIYPELIETMRDEPKICRYLDLPIQHCDDDILRRMGRKTTRADLIRIVQGLREAVPGIALRTTLITGFPGESEQAHQSLLSFIREMKFDRLGVFLYSREEGTPAAMMEDQIPQEVKERRRDELMEAQQEIASQLSESRVGSELTVQIEGFLASDEVYVARTEFDTPGVDGYCFVSSDELLDSGDFICVAITEASVYDLIGEAISEREGEKL